MFYRQICSIHFSIFTGYQFMILGNSKLIVEETFVPNNSKWVLEKEILKNESHGVTFSFQLRRRSRFFVVNLFCPGLILTLLELTSFLIPPDTPDRPTYTVTIMLAMFLLHSQVLSYLPRTSSPILASYYVLGEIFFAMLCTIYSTYICYLLNSHNIAMMKYVFKNKLKLFELVERVVLFSAISIIVIFNLICMFLVGIF